MNSTFGLTGKGALVNDPVTVGAFILSRNVKPCTGNDGTAITLTVLVLCMAALPAASVWSYVIGYEPIVFVSTVPAYVTSTVGSVSSTA